MLHSTLSTVTEEPAGNSKHIAEDCFCLVLLCDRPIGRVTRLARPSVRPSVCPSAPYTGL